jgi:hypothetical protein
MRWARNVAHKMRNVNKMLVRKPEGKKQLGDTGVDGRITLKLISKDNCVKVFHANDILF